MKIPRIFHQAWLGPKPFPEEHARYQRTWLAHHPGWELRMWTEENLPRDLRRQEALERLRHPLERTDLLRLELVWRFGGVYFDTDFECLRSLEPLIEQATFFIGCSKPGSPQDGFFGAVPGHPILDLALDQLALVDDYGPYQPSRKQYARAIEAYRDEVVFLEPAVLYSKPGERDRAYALHHDARSWKDATLLLQRVRQLKAKERKWRTRYEKAAEESTRWRTRCQEAEAELKRLNSEAGKERVAPR